MLSHVSLSNSYTHRYAERPVSKGIDTTRMASWTRAKHVDRLAEAYRVIQKQGGKVFTLRLDQNALVSVTGSKSATRTMSRRIQRAFKRSGLPVPDIAFSLEVSPDDREELHIHGAIVIAGLDLPKVKDALRDAAERIAGRAGSRQVQLKNFDNERGGPEGWARYPQKGAARTRRVIDHNRLIYISDGLSKLAGTSWDARRAQSVTGLPS